MKDFIPIALFVFLATMAGYTFLTWNEDTHEFDCKDFETQERAQEAHDRSMAKYGYDRHHLDSNNNKVACEKL